MKDPEFNQLKNRFILALFISLIIVIPLAFIFINKFSFKSAQLVKSLNNKEDLVVFVTKEDCSYCKKVKEILDNHQVKYYILNEKDQEEYQKILHYFSLNIDKINLPMVIYVEDGQMYANIDSIDDEKTITDFLQTYKLENR